MLDNSLYANSCNNLPHFFDFADFARLRFAHSWSLGVLPGRSLTTCAASFLWSSSIAA